MSPYTHEESGTHLELFISAGSVRQADVRFRVLVVLASLPGTWKYFVAVAWVAWHA